MKGPGGMNRKLARCGDAASCQVRQTGCWRPSAWQRLDGRTRSNVRDLLPAAAEVCGEIHETHRCSIRRRSPPFAAVALSRRIWHRLASSGTKMSNS